jgi:hypothetical protein
MATAPSDLVDIVLVNGGEKLIHVIKEIRGLTGSGLAEARDMAQQTPSVIASGVPRPEAEAALAKLESVGAAVELRSASGETVSSLPAGATSSVELLVQRGALSETEQLDLKAAMQGKPSEEFRTMTRMLTELHHLYEQGILSEAEFNTKKWEVLARKV